MAYTKTGFTKRINYFSSPVLTYNGVNPVKTGTATRDVRRVHLERRGNMAAIGDESGTCKATVGSGPTSGPPTGPKPPPCTNILNNDVCAFANTFFSCCQWACFALCSDSCGVCN
jgi:hypothetical protein